MQSRLLSTLSAQARTTKDPVVWARAICRAASQFARHGRTDEALNSIAVVRKQFGPELQFEVASWLMLAEGVLHYFKAETKQSYDRIRRAYGLAVALGTESALPSCASWMAHVEFHDCDYERMATHLEEALTKAKVDDHQAHARAALVLANAFQLAGSYALARPWYEHARQHSAAEGDEATLSALLYNVAAFRLSNIRLADAFGEDNPSERQRAGMETASSVNFDFAIGTAGLDFLSELLRSQMLTVERKYSEALEMSALIDIERVPAHMRSPIFAERSWCHANEHRLDDAWSNAEKALACLDHITEHDDRAYVCARLAGVARACAKGDLAANLHSEASTALSAHRSFQAELLSRISSIRTESLQKE